MIATPANYTTTPTHSGQPAMAEYRTEDRSTGWLSRLRRRLEAAVTAGHLTQAQADQIMNQIMDWQHR